MSNNDNNILSNRHINFIDVSKHSIISYILKLLVVFDECIKCFLYFVSIFKIMLPQKTKIFAVIMATLMSLGSLSLMPLDVYGSHSFEAGVQGDNIPDNTHVNLNGITLPPLGVVPLYDSSPNFFSGHFLYRGPCDPNTHEPLVSVIAGHFDESREMTHVDFVPLYYIDHASTAGSCVYHAHIPDPLNGGSPRNTDVDLINFSDESVTFNPGDVIDINVQRTLGSIEEYYEGNQQLPSDLAGGNNPIFDLNDDNPNNDGLGHVE